MTDISALKGKKFEWTETTNQEDEDAGWFYVLEHEDVTRGTIEILEVDSDTITYKWTGQANVYWNDEIGSDVPFDAVVVARRTRNYIQFIRRD